jgi:arginine decarboxylase
MPDFGREDAISLYNVDRWSDGYFTVNRKGNIVVLPSRSNDQKIDLMEIVAEAKERKLGFPLTVRFHDLLRDRVETINKAFADAIETMGYRNVYRGVFPIKVNQLREVVEEILDAGKRWHFGIEAGSKPELMAALAFHDDPESLIICNGYKEAQICAPPCSEGSWEKP